MTDTAQYAHVVLPTTAFGEEQVSFTSTERRIQLAAKVIDPPSGLTPAWQQLIRLARLMGADWKYRVGRRGDARDRRSGSFLFRGKLRESRT